jgi:hypothetical protein
LSYCPRSSLPVEVLGWLVGRLAHLTPPRPPGKGGTPPLALEVRLDAVAAVLLDGLSYPRAGRVVGISKTEVGDSLDLLLGALGALGALPARWQLRPVHRQARPVAFSEPIGVNGEPGPAHRGGCLDVGV